MNLFSILDRAVDKCADATAIVDHRRRMTYREIHAAAESFARQLEIAGIQQGDKVAILFPRGAEEIVACFGVARLGGVVVQLSPASKAAEIARLSERLVFNTIVYSPLYEPLIPRERTEAPHKLEVEEPFLFCIHRAEEKKHHPWSASKY